MSANLSIQPWAFVALVMGLLAAVAWQQHRLRQARRISQERFQKIYEVTPDAMGITRARDGRYIDINPSFARLSGYSREEVLGRTALDLNIWADPGVRAAVYQEFLRQGRIDLKEISVRRKDGQLITGLLSMLALVEGGEDCYLFIFRDTTERERLQQEAEASRAQVLAAAAANQAKSEFLSRMSHELRTPMNAVLGFAQLLRDSPALSLAGNRRELGRVDAILRAGWHLLTLIDDVLDISRIETGHMQVELGPLAMKPVLDEAVALLRPQAEAAGVALKIGGREGWSHALIGDPLRLRQSLVNLLSNAIKYNHRGGSVSVHGAVENGRYLLRISDTGRGMDEQQLAHLFEPFNRLGREHEGIDGTGIGLVLTQHLLTLMGGSLRLESERGRGTTATMTLLLAPEDSPPAAPAPAVVSPPPDPASYRDIIERESRSPSTVDARSRVLYIEDNPVNQEIVQQALQNWLHVDLHLAGDGAEGLRRAAELLPDLILLDMRLPDTDGIEVLTRLRAQAALADIKVVALSASAMPDEVAQATTAGALEYWTKPLNLQQFLADMRRVLN